MAWYVEVDLTALTGVADDWHRFPMPYRSRIDADQFLTRWINPAPMRHVFVCGEAPDVVERWVSGCVVGV